MSDSYQAIYDAVRSRISGGNIGEAVAEVARQMFDISHLTTRIADEYQRAAFEQQRPFVLLRPSIFPEGNMWCALYGKNLVEGVCGFGETPEKAAEDFDKVWRTQTLKRPQMSADGGRDHLEEAALAKATQPTGDTHE